MRNREKFTFTATCDNFRKTTKGEAHWQSMIKNRRPISRHAFAQACRLSTMLEKGEKWTEWGADDPGTAFFASRLADGTPCCYAQYAGFEFIFIPSTEAQATHKKAPA